MTALALARPYLAFARTSFLNLLAYRARYFVGILTYFFNATVWYYIWRALFHEKGAGATLGGFTFPQMLTYVTTGWALRSFYFNEVDREIASQVREGRLAMTLIKPIDVQAMTLSQALGESAFRLVLFTLPIGVLLGLVYPVLPPAGPAAFGLFLLSGLLSPCSSAPSTSASASSPSAPRRSSASCAPSTSSSSSSRASSSPWRSSPSPRERSSSGFPSCT